MDSLPPNPSLRSDSRSTLHDGTPQGAALGPKSSYFFLVRVMDAGLIGCQHSDANGRCATRTVVHFSSLSQRSLSRVAPIQRPALQTYEDGLSRHTVRPWSRATQEDWYSMTEDPIETGVVIAGGDPT